MQEMQPFTVCQFIEVADAYVVFKNAGKICYGYEDGETVVPERVLCVR